MEDSGAILCQISSFKDMLDQVNEEIEANIEITREIESEIVKCSEVEKDYLMRESELTKMVSIGEFELNGLVQVTATTKKSLELMETESALLKLNLEDLVKAISGSRERFIAACNNFQRNITTGENEELHALMLEKETLLKEKLNLIRKVDALRNSTGEFIEDVLEEFQNSSLENAALQVEIECKGSENSELLKDIDELKILLHSICLPQRS